MTRVDANEWARRIARYGSDQEYRALLGEIGGSGERSEILAALASYRDPVVRAWAADASVELVGVQSIRLLRSLLEDRDSDVRDIARDHLLDLDPGFKEEVLPQLHRVLKRANDWYGEDRAAMWRLARWDDRSAVPILREYATKFPPTDYAHRMPLVLADYLDDPRSVARRIRSHDHDWMFWLIEAALGLDAPGYEDAIETAAAAKLDPECAKHLDEALVNLQARREHSRDVARR